MKSTWMCNVDIGKRGALMWESSKDNSQAEISAHLSCMRWFRSVDAYRPFSICQPFSCSGNNTLFAHCSLPSFLKSLLSRNPANLFPSALSHRYREH